MRVHVVCKIKGNPEAEAALAKLRLAQKEIDERKEFLYRQIEALEKTHEDAWSDFFSEARKHGNVPESFSKSDADILQIEPGDEHLFIVTDRPIHQQTKV